VGALDQIRSCAHKTPRRRRIPSYCDFATHTPIDVLIMRPQLVIGKARR
jgi:hypothetical protein